MRIGYIVADGGVPVYGSKGASVHVREFIRALARDHEVDLFCAALGSDVHHLPVGWVRSQPRPAVPSSGDAALDRDRTRVATVDAMAARVASAHATMPYDFIYERYALFSTVGLSIARSSGVPFLLEVNAPLIAERRRVEPLPLAPLARARERENFAGADAVLCVSAAMAAYALKQGALPSRVHVVPNAVDMSRFHPLISGGEIRAQHGLGTSLTVGFVGSLKPWHGVDLLLQAFQQEAEPDWRLLIIGEGPEAASLKTLACQLGVDRQVLFVGAVHHDVIPQYVAALDIAVAPYRGSAAFYFSPLKLYEYLAAGRAVLASDVGQISSTIRHLENGYLVASDDAGSLAAGLRQLADDRALRSALEHAAPDGITSWDQVAVRVLDIAAATRAA